MKINHLRREVQSDGVIVSAVVQWEDCDRGQHEVFYKVPVEFGDALVCSPDAFLLACAIPAMHYGERRLSIDGRICPALREGVITAMAWIRHWYGDPGQEPLRIESGIEDYPKYDHRPRRAALFLSGGVDSLSTLRANQLNVPETHPLRIKDGILVYGLEMDTKKAFEYVFNTVKDIAHAVGVTMIPVETNLYLHYRNEDVAAGNILWERKFEGAALASIAHALAGRIGTMSIASSYDIVGMQPLGSHPLLDPNYSSCDLRIFHDGLTMSRFEKTRLISDWDMVLDKLRVCNRYEQYTEERQNCGQCEKCIRTKLALLALGVLPKTNAFAENDVSADMVMAKVNLTNAHSHLVVSMFKELVEPLRAAGRQDLVKVIEFKIKEHCRQAHSLKGKLKRIDKQYLGGGLRVISRRMRRGWTGQSA